MHYETLRDNLFVDIDYPSAITDLIGKAEPWRSFCALPRELKEKFSFLTHQKDEDPGYKWRSKVEGREDKEYFHIYPNARELIGADATHGLVARTPALNRFFDYGLHVHKAAHDFALKIGKEIGQGIPKLAKLVEGGEIRSVLRLLHYTNDEKTDVIAAQHFDRSLYTLHLYESGPGLQFMNWDMQWTDAPIALGKTVVFSGYRLEQLTKGTLQKTWHRVARKENAKGRTSMVLFVWTDAIPSYDPEARSQDLQPSYIRMVG